MSDRAKAFLAWRAAQKPRIARPFDDRELVDRGAPMRVDKYDYGRFVKATMARHGYQDHVRSNRPREIATPPVMNFLTSISNTMVPRHVRISDPA